MSRMQRLACWFGLHGSLAGSIGAARQLPDLRWCLRCGRTWESTYDGIEAGWRVRPDLWFGHPTEESK